MTTEELILKAIEVMEIPYTVEMVCEREDGLVEDPPYKLKVEVTRWDVEEAFRRGGHRKRMGQRILEIAIERALHKKEMN